MKTLKELKIEMELARETYNEHLKTLEPYKRAYLKALETYDNALDAALATTWKSKEKRTENEHHTAHG
jgi:hypothetical protein